MVESAQQQPPPQRRIGREPPPPPPPYRHSSKLIGVLIGVILATGAWLLTRTPTRAEPSQSQETATAQPVAQVTAQIAPETVPQPASEPERIPTSVGMMNKPTWANALGTDQYGTWADLKVGGVTQRFRLIKPGSFQMGSNNGDSEEKPEHQVTISQPFWLADSECTQGMWQEVIGSNPSHFTGDTNRPVEQVSWEDCQGFIQKLNSQVSGLRSCLPNESQWEYACRAGTNGDFAGAMDGMAWHSPMAGQQTHPVKAKQANAWGLYDMHGNVLEWCADWFGPYALQSQRDPTGPSSGSRRVQRGGGWGSYPRNSRSAFRLSFKPDDRDYHAGFRIAIQATP